MEKLKKAFAGVAEAAAAVAAWDLDLQRARLAMANDPQIALPKADQLHSMLVTLASTADRRKTTEAVRKREQATAAKGKQGQGRQRRPVPPLRQIGT